MIKEDWMTSQWIKHINKSHEEEILTVSKRENYKPVYLINDRFITTGIRKWRMANYMDEKIISKRCLIVEGKKIYGIKQIFGMKSLNGFVVLNLNKDCV